MEYRNYGIRDENSNVMKYDIPASSALPIRPGYNTQGKAVNIRVNQYKVLDAPRNDIYQYDVSIPNSLFTHFQL